MHFDSALSVHFSAAGGERRFVFFFLYLYYNLSVLRQVNVLQRVLHQKGEVHLVHGHVRQCWLLHREGGKII